MGQFGEYVKMALYNIKENKGRSFVTMLGIIIGISSVITIVSIGSGLKADVMSTGDVKSVSVMTDAEETTNLEMITWEDIQALKDSLGDRIKGISSLTQAVGKIETRKGSFDAYVFLTIPDEEYNPSDLPVIRGEEEGAQRQKSRQNHADCRAEGGGGLPGKKGYAQRGQKTDSLYTQNIADEAQDHFIVHCKFLTLLGENKIPSLNS